MATSLAKFHSRLLLLFLSLLALHTIDHVHANNNFTTHSTICESTPDPAFCLSALPNATAGGDLNSSVRFFMRSSLARSRKFVALVDRLLLRRASMKTPAVRALEDCHHLARRNRDFLVTSFKAVHAAPSEDGLPTLQSADDVRTLLSAVLTNQMTCSDGLQSTPSNSSFLSSLHSRILQDTKWYSASLALFNKDKVSNMTRRATWHSLIRPMNTSGKDRPAFESLYEWIRGSQTTDDEEISWPGISGMAVVRQDGRGHFTTINAAIAAAPNDSDHSDGYFLIYVTADVYNEYVFINERKKNLMMIGEGINQTVISGNRNNHNGWSTFNSATFISDAPYFIGWRLTIRNTAGPEKGQAVALRNGGDQSTFLQCSFEGYQDTLLAHSQKQLYRECDIYGTVDFIFGNADAIFESCNIYPRRPLRGQYNTITAQGRSSTDQNTGTYFRNCTVRAADDLASSEYPVETYLGRPWRDYARVVYLDTFMDSVIQPAGWHYWTPNHALDTVYYAEYDNVGPGSDTRHRVTWPGYHVLTDEEAARISGSEFSLG